jgi:hypothetical protein
MQRFAASFVTALCLVCAGVAAQAEILLEEEIEFGKTAVSRSHTVTVEITDPEIRAGIRFKPDIELGSVRLTVVSPSGTDMLQAAFVPGAPPFKQILQPFAQGGDCKVQVDASEAAGDCSFTLVRAEPNTAGASLALRGALLTLIAAGVIAACSLWTREPLRWFAAGAAVWALGAGLKWVWTARIGVYLLDVLSRNAPAAVHAPAQAVYEGLVTGIFEVGAAYAAAFALSALAANRHRALAVAVGAGASKALILGIVMLVNSAYAFLFREGAASVIIATTIGAASVPAFWLHAPLGRGLGIVCHAASRFLAFRSAAGGGLNPLLAGAALLALAGMFMGFQQAESAWAWLSVAAAGACAVVGTVLTARHFTKWEDAASEPPEKTAPAEDSE